MNDFTSVPSIQKLPISKKMVLSTKTVLETTLSTPFLSKSTSSSSSLKDEESSSSYGNSPKSDRSISENINDRFLKIDISGHCPPSGSHRSLAVLSDHVGSVSCLALCGEFVLSASQGKDIIVWQQPDLRKFAKFGHGDGSVKALATIGNKVFTAHQDSRIRVWKVSRSSENIFKLIATMPTTKDYLGKFMKQSNYVQTRRNHRRLWIEHADSISCLAVFNGMIYSGSWDKTLKVWRISDLKCLESIKAHDDAINGLIADKGMVYSASADGKIKIWTRSKTCGSRNHCLWGVLEGHKDVSFNSVIVCEDGGFENWKLVCDLKAHQMSVLCLCTTGEFVCSGSADKSIGIWKRGVEGKLYSVGVIRGHEGPIKCLQASSSGVGGGFLLYSGSLDRSLRVWWVPKEYCVKKEVIRVS